MSQKAQVKMMVNLDQKDESQSQLLFSRWFPREEDALSFYDNGYSVKYWTDFDCLNHLGEVDPNEIPRMVNVKVGMVKVLVDLEVENENMEELAYYCSTTSNYSDEEVNQLFGESTLEEYYAMGPSIYAVIMTGLNRWLGYIRSKKGQYWLEDYSVLDKNYSSEFNKNRAQIRFGERDWAILRWKRVLEFTAMLPSQECLLTKEDWTEVQAFLSTRKKIPLVGHLLSIADKLSSEGFSRTALIEGVSALEVGVNEFGRMARENCPTQYRDPSISHSYLAKHIKHLGLRGSINYLLPILIREDVISQEVWKCCQKAIEERNNVVHNGKQDLLQEDLDRYLRGIRLLCSKLGVL